MLKECYDWIVVRGSRRRLENLSAVRKIWNLWRNFLSTLQNDSRGNDGLDLDRTTEGSAGFRENYLSRPRLPSYVNIRQGALDSGIDSKINATYGKCRPERCIERIKAREISEIHTSVVVQPSDGKRCLLHPGNQRDGILRADRVRLIWDRSISRRCRDRRIVAA